MVQWRMKYEDDAIQRAEDVGDAKKKLAIRLQDAAEAMGVANVRNTSPERARHQLQLELGDALLDLGKACSVAAALEQKQRHVVKSLEDWRQRLEESQAMLDASEGGRDLSTQLLRLRHAYEESTRSQETLQRGKKNLEGHTMAVESLGVHRAWLSIRAEDGSLEENASCHQGSRVEPNTSRLSQKEKLEVDVVRMQKEVEDAVQGFRNAEEKAKKTATEAEEDKKNLTRMQTLMDNLQLKVQSYKQQIEAVEAQANQYLTKHKKQQHELNEAKERAEIAESHVNKLKIKAKESGKQEMCVKAVEQIGDLATETFPHRVFCRGRRLHWQDKAREE
ncbi:myosin heavy chain 15 [Rhinolophus ferrumequinum]|uniref:Myosin heavy chain 15 n=1 Tax=Rhinolophus ferrumequinum TaxID=59479 RepID=A0A7J8AF64_RHIFE|nr:myosin heavy chain 15 [Rhinolophus ferrumequinum]